MELWQEIVFLEHWFKGKWVVENVKSYYPPLGLHIFNEAFKVEQKTL